MAEQEPSETTNLSGYGDAPLEWSRARERLETLQGGPEVTWFLGTVRPDGRPHAAGIGALYHDGDLYFVSGPETRKSQNLRKFTAGTISVHLKGMDLVFEGEAERIKDSETVAAVAELYRKQGWPAEVEGDRITGPYSAPSAGPPPWYIYRFGYHTVFGVAGEEPHGATRWRFAI